MNDSTRVMRRSWRATTATVIATVGLALLAAACGGGRSAAGGSPSAGGSTSAPSAVAYSRCMRSHGVPQFPDPDSSGELAKTDAQRLRVSNSQLQTAQRACQPLLPATGGSLQDQAHQCMVAADCPPALVQRMLTAQRTFARCMRSRGFAKFPDPTFDSQGRPVFVWSISTTGMNPNSTQFQAKENDCQRLGGLGGPRELSS